MESTHVWIHYLHVKGLLIKAVKDVRFSYFSNFISNTKYNPTILFDTISNSVTPPLPVVQVSQTP